MKKNLESAMERLEIDIAMRPLLRQMWKHCYVTRHCCEGHGKYPAYVTFKENTGDGWFEQNSSAYDLEKVVSKGECCNMTMEWSAKSIVQVNHCVLCGAGLNGTAMYEGNLISELLPPKYKK